MFISKRLQKLNWSICRRLTDSLWVDEKVIPTLTELWYAKVNVSLSWKWAPLKKECAIVDEDIQVLRNCHAFRSRSFWRWARAEPGSPDWQPSHCYSHSVSPISWEKEFHYFHVMLVHFGVSCTRAVRWFVSIMLLRFLIKQFDTFLEIFFPLLSHFQLAMLQNFGALFSCFSYWCWSVF